MILIAHRGNQFGPNPNLENKPSYVNNALNNEYNVEIDVWYDKGWWLGHDKPQYKISYKWMIDRQVKLWIHCKNIDAIYKFTDKCQKSNVEYLNYFWHQNDDCVLTSQGFLWTYPGKPLTKRSIAVLPEISKNYTNLQLKKCWGICSDYSIRKFQ